MRDLTMFPTFEAFAAHETQAITAKYEASLAELAAKIADPWIMEITAAARDRLLAEMNGKAKKEWAKYLESEEARVIEDATRALAQYPSLRGKRVEFGRDGSLKIARIRGPHEKGAEAVKEGQAFLNK